MSEYLLINILVVILPLVMSFEKQLKFYKTFPAVLLSVAIVGTAFIIWDSYAAVRGDWSFNEDYILKQRLFNLPLEEILFFITIPFSSIFLYETAKLYLRNRILNFKRSAFGYLSVLFIGFAILFYKQYYTSTVFIFTAAFVFLVFITDPKFIRETIYWKWILFTYLPFFIVNYFLTSLPIISYSPQAIWGIRITAIPLEDFLYSYTLLSLNLFFYLYAKERWLVKK